MALNSSNVRVAVTGSISVAPLGTTGPTSLTTALAGFSDLGYVSEDGVTESTDRQTDEIKAWQNADVVRNIVTGASKSWQFTMIESKKETLELYYGGATTANGSIIIRPAETGGRKCYVLDIVDSSNLTRFWLPEAEITEVGDVSYKNGEPIGYDVTITAYPSESLSGGVAEMWKTELAA